MNVSICPIYGYGTLVKYMSEWNAKGMAPLFDLKLAFISRRVMSGWNAEGMAPLSSSPAGASGAACGMVNVGD